MIQQILNDLFTRDLGNLKTELESYQNESDIWATAGEIKNSGGNLALHLCGNLRHFIGAVLGDTGYVRDRDAEFATKYVPRGEIIANIDLTIQTINAMVPELTDVDLAKTYPIEVFGKPMTTGWFLTHLATHLTYHLGQVNYHRRLISSANELPAS